MPLFDDPDMQTHALGGSPYGFSGKRVAELGASEYTLAVIAADVSGSVSSFRLQIERCVKEIAAACRRSPRADHLLLRTLTFDQRLSEVHGFRPLTECDPDRYDGCIVIGGCTALYDAAHNAVASVADYGASLSAADFGVNAIVFVLTDGCDNASTFGVREVEVALRRAVTSEALESVVSVLVGVNVSDRAVGAALLDFSAKAGFTQYVEIGKADAKTLARLAAFVSRSIAAQSRSLGTGGPSLPLTF
jgi:uncharacterized protein YegL